MKHGVSPSQQLAPVRLIAGGGSARERRLLEAAADDVMPPGTPERLERALSAWAALPAGRGSTPARAPLGTRLSRWGIVGGLGGLAMVAWMLGRRPDAVVPSPSPGPVPATPAQVTSVAVAPAPAAEPAPLQGASHSVAPTLETKSVRRPREAAGREPREPREPGPAASTAQARLGERSDSPGNLLEEARRLEAVRSLLDAQDGPAARRELAKYRARFPRGELALEADVLEADLLLFAGEPERARALANTLLARPDAPRYRQRLEQLLQRARTSERRASPQRPSGPAGSKPAAINMDERR